VTREGHPDIAAVSHDNALQAGREEGIGIH
jgi:hypothetical protein